MLIYERKNFQPMIINENNEEPYIEDIKKEIYDDNNNSLREYYVSGGGFQNFMLDFLNTLSSKSLPIEDEFKLITTCCNYVTSHLLYTDISLCVTFLRKLTTIFSENETLSYKYVQELVDNPLQYKKIFFKCYNSDVRTYYATFISTLMINSISFEYNKNIITSDCYKKPIDNTTKI